MALHDSRTPVTLHPCASRAAAAGLVRGVEHCTGKARIRRGHRRVPDRRPRPKHRRRRVAFARQTLKALAQSKAAVRKKSLSDICSPRRVAAMRSAAAHFSRIHGKRCADVALTAPAPGDCLYTHAHGSNCRAPECTLRQRSLRSMKIRARFEREQGFRGACVRWRASRSCRTFLRCGRETLDRA